MTDNEIIKALEHCLYKSHRESKCTECEHVTGCKPYLLREALDLINRQKAEIERLREKNKAIMQTMADVHAEAIKEFAERVKKAMRTGAVGRDKENRIIIDNLVKEMVGDE